jgi:membrane protein
VKRITTVVSNAWSYLHKLLSKFSEDNCFLLAGGVAYFTIFSLVPILLVILAVFSYFIGQEAVKAEIFELVQLYMGQASAVEIIRLIDRAHQPVSSIMTAVLGLVTLMFTSSTLFVNLKNSLNIIWDVKGKVKGGAFKTIKDRGLAFLMVLMVGLLLIFSIFLETTAALFFNFFAEYVPLSWILGLGLVENLVLFVVLFLLFGSIFKFLPDVEIRWRDVRFGALITTLLFLVGRQGISLYLSRSDMTEIFGPASAMVAILLWVYYSALIFFLGAEITQIHSRLVARKLGLAENVRAQKGRARPSSD